MKIRSGFVSNSSSSSFVVIFDIKNFSYDSFLNFFKDDQNNLKSKEYYVKRVFDDIVNDLNKNKKEYLSLSPLKRKRKFFRLFFDSNKEYSCLSFGHFLPKKYSDFKTFDEYFEYLKILFGKKGLRFLEESIRELKCEYDNENRIAIEKHLHLFNIICLMYKNYYKEPYARIKYEKEFDKFEKYVVYKLIIKNLINSIDFENKYFAMLDYDNDYIENKLFYSSTLQHIKINHH